METLAVKFVGGPFNGTRTTQQPWPMPDILKFSNGRYVKTNQSAISDEEIKTMTRVMRGVEYKWLDE